MFEVARPGRRTRAACRCAAGGAILTAGLVLAGCAGGGTGSPSTTVTPTVVPTSTVAPAPTAVPTSTAAPTASPSSDGTSCVSPNLDYAQGARGKAGDPVDLAREDVTGLREGDVVERDNAEGSVRIVRAGAIVGSITYALDGAGGWLLMGGMLCDGLGLRS